MSLTLRDLVAFPELDLRLLTGGPDLDRAVTWVHVSELIDPTPFLTGGELLLTTGMAFDSDSDSDSDSGPTDDGGSPGYVERLRSAGVLGLGFGTGLSHGQVPRDLLGTARRRGLPVVEVPRQTPFIAISRTVSNAIAADDYAAVTRTFAAQQTLTKAALSHPGPAEVVRLLAQQVGGWVGLLDASGASLAVYPDSAGPLVPALAGEVAQLRGHRGSVSSAFPLGDDTVSLQPVGTGRRRRAFLAVGRPGALSAADRHLVNTAVLLLTVRLEQSTGEQRGLAGLRAAMMRLLLAGKSDLVRPIAEAVAEQLPPEPLTVIVAIGPDDGSVAALALDDHAGRSAPGWLIADLDGRLVVIVGGDDPGAEELVGLLGHIGGMSVGVSQAPDYPGVGAAHRQAVQAAEFGRRGGGGVTRFPDIAMPGITGLIDPADGRTFAESLLSGLIEHDRTGRGELLTSLRVWLSHHGQWDPSAAELGVHRHTLRNRIKTAEQVLGRSLDSPGTRSELWLALQIAQPWE